MHTVVGFALNYEVSLVVEAPHHGAQKVIVKEKRKGMAGSPITVAQALRILDFPVHILGVVGRDGEQLKFEAALANWGVSHDLFPLRETTPEAFCAINGTGEAMIFSHREPLIMDGQVENVLSRIRQVADNSKVSCVVATSIRPEDVPLTEALFGSAPPSALRVLNPNLHLIREEATFRKICSQASFLIVNRSEAEEILSASEKEGAAFLFLVQGLLEYTPEAIVTLGSQGSLYSNRSAEYHYQAAPEVSVVDTTGAGHTYLGGFIAGRFRGLSNPESMKLASAMAAARIQHLGGYVPPSWEEVQTYL